MRELWTTGWMHNRVRMVVASFLIKHLLIDWRAGEKWFWDTLVDADPANNAANWQWVAGSGADAAPYFRIFNPILQGEKFDPNGDYVRRWVPELARLPSKVIHKPWTAQAGATRRRTTYASAKPTHTPSWTTTKPATGPSGTSSRWRDQRTAALPIRRSQHRHRRIRDHDDDEPSQCRRAAVAAR